MARMSRAEYDAARLEVAMAMDYGVPWEEAVARAGLTTGRTSAYTWRALLRDYGPGIFCDGRHGHPYKSPPALRNWLIQTCRLTPTITAAALRDLIQQTFQISLTTRQIDKLRNHLGVARRQLADQKKATTSQPR